MLRTVKIKLDYNEALVRTVEVYNKVRTEICSIAFKHKTRRKTELHRLTYFSLREEFPGFPSALLQTARDSVVEVLRSTKFKKKIQFKPYSSVRLDKRNLRVNLEHHLISVSSVEGRIKTNYTSNCYLNKYLVWRTVAGTLCFRRGQLWLNLVVEKKNPMVIANSESKILGIDRGVNNILVTSDDIFFNSNHLKEVKGKYQFLKSGLQAKGTRSAKRKLKKLAGRERRFVCDLNHCLSKEIVESGFEVFALEELKISKRKKNGRKFNRKLGNWSFKQFETFLKYKAEALGKLVLNVNPAYTSQTCSKCSHTEKANRNASKFKCRQCGFELHSDLNAARNIARLGMSELSRLFVNEPIVTLNETVSNTVKSSYKPILLSW